MYNPQNRNENEDQTTYCERCDIKFETQKAYSEHFQQSVKHANDFQLSEDQELCGKHFSTQAACRKHHLAEHPRTSFFAPNERHICEICGMSLAPGSVSSHLNTHTREKLYSCSTCGRQFNSKGGMTTHQLTHTSEKPVACTLCDKRFKQTSSMKLHYRTFHLKEPYPKRNRKKKSEEGSGSKLEEYPPEESDENLTLDRWP
ncbi:unnamed protein product [Arctia plantaginis]|uniref:C2H2-type domain-containing protein n=1 Tax=Arctia plantaginis TaxID=874455 RepID=A0A8S1A881_ARCPL|nr:unnamed protein product [Arctia plantaginis]